MDLILFGMQGSGKGTLGKALADQYGLTFFETGAELRKLSKEDSELGRKIASIINAGELVSNEVVMEIVENFLNHLANPQQGVLFDGIPRSVNQAETLNTMLAKHNRDFRAVFLDIKKETALARLEKRKTLEGRADDTDEAIRRRLENYEKETKPAIALYQSKMIHLDGEPDIETVRDLALAALNPVMQS